MKQSRWEFLQGPRLSWCPEQVTVANRDLVIPRCHQKPKDHIHSLPTWAFWKAAQIWSCSDKTPSQATSLEAEHVFLHRSWVYQLRSLYGAGYSPVWSLGPHKTIATSSWPPAPGWAIYLLIDFQWKYQLKKSQQQGMGAENIPREKELWAL